MKIKCLSIAKNEVKSMDNMKLKHIVVGEKIEKITIAQNTIVLAQIILFFRNAEIFKKS
jgi:hypothetical protein